MVADQDEKEKTAYCFRPSNGGVTAKGLASELFRRKTVFKK